MARRNTISYGTVCAVLLGLWAAAVAQRSPYDPSLWSGLRYRMIGPERGGRVTAVTGVPYSALFCACSP